MPIQYGSAPIIVTGLGRSGTTWMQHFLSRHPRIHIHGQPPGFDWSHWWQWYQRLLGGCQFSEIANRNAGYKLLHFAGCRAERWTRMFKRLLIDYMCDLGEKKPRWGMKWLELCSHPTWARQFISLWPDTRWVVCIRDPFVTIASAKNTFVPNLEPEHYAGLWVETCRFAHQHDPARTVIVQIDQLARQGHKERQAAMDRVVECCGESPTAEMRQFVRAWPIIHKVVPDGQRRYSMDPRQQEELLRKVGELSEWIVRMGYSLPGRSGDAEGDAV
jgi:hypothetical protein